MENSGEIGLLKIRRGGALKNFGGIVCNLSVIKNFSTNSTPEMGKLYSNYITFRFKNGHVKLD